MKSRGLKLSLPIALSVVLLLLLIVPVFAQSAQLAAGVTAPQSPLAIEAVSPYSFITTTTTYTEITSGTLHGSGTSVDDNNYNAVSLGFTFRFNGVNFTQVSINANGFLAMGSSVSSSYTPLSSGTSNNVIAALANDLKGNTGGSLRSELTGTAPNRVFVIQWKDFGSYYSTMPGDESYNFQIRLYETSNLVEVIYGPFTKNSTNRTEQVGLRGASSADYKNLKTTTATTGSWSSPLSGTSNTDAMGLTTSLYPASGLVYQFIAPPPAPDFSASTKAVSPSGTRFTGEVLTYTVAIVNSGDLTGTTTTLSDPIPAGVSFIDGSAQVQGGGTLTATASSIEWSGEIAPSDRVTVTFQVTLTAQTGSVTNTATISDALISAAVVKSVNTVVAAPNYGTSTKVVSPQVHVGQRATYTVTLINTGLSTGSATTLIDPIPVGTSYVDSSAAVQGGGTLVADTTGITWTGSIAPSQRVTVTYQVTLTASSGSITNTATITDPMLTATVIKTASTALQSPVGGPDSGGYTYADSYAPGGPTFTWVFTTGVSTMIPTFTGGNDDGYAQIPLGFDFRFYTSVYTQAFASTNGLVTFGSGSTAYANAAIPSSSLPNNFATCFWDDQEIEAATAQGIWYETFGVAPNRYAVVTFVLQNRTTGAVTPYEYQMILSEGTEQVLCQYRSMSGATAGDGKSATVGLENASGTIGLQYSSNKNPGPIEDNLAILFNPGVGYASSTKTVQPTGSVTPGQVLTYTVVVANDGALTSAATLNDPIPAGTTYVPGSAALVGTGTLTATGSAIEWSGNLASGENVTTTFQVTVTAISGAITNTAVISDPLLVAPVVRTASNPVVCSLPDGLSFTYDPLAPLANQSIDFTGAVTGGTPPFVYTWDFDDGSPIEAGNPIAHSYAITGTFNVTLTVTNVCGANSTSQAVIVNDAATPPTLAALQSSSPTVLGNATFFTGTLVAGSAPITYTWDFGDGTVVEDGLTINHTYTETGQYEVSLSAENAAGTDTVTTTVDVGVAPTASFSFADPTTYPDPTAFTFTGEAGTPPTSYLWTFGDGFTSTVASPTHSYAAPQPVNLYTATLTVQNDYGVAVTSTVVTVLNTSADLGIVKSDAPDPVAAGGALTYTLAISNFGPNALIGAPIAAYPFTNTTYITIPSSGAATPYPSAINVSGITDVVGKVRVTLHGISHTFPSDMDVLLVGPGGQSVILMSDVGGTSAVSNVIVTFDDDAAASVPASSLPSGTYKPTNSGTGDTFPAPAPTSGYGAVLSSFAGINPNGAWGLYAVDDATGDSGAITSGWSLELTTVTPVTTTVTDILPTGYTFGGAGGNGWTCANNSGTVTCTRDAFPIGAAPNIVITGNAPALTVSGDITNTATVASELPDLNTANNTAEITTSVNALQSDLGVIKTDSPDPVGVGETVTYQITVTNTGPDATSGATVIDTLPASFQFASASAGCANASGTVTCAIGALNNGQSAAANIVVTATQLGTFTNTVTVSGPNPDPDSSNNTASTTTTVASPNINVTPASLNAAQFTNQVTTQTLTINNTGPVALLWDMYESLPALTAVDAPPNLPAVFTAGMLARAAGKSEVNFQAADLPAEVMPTRHTIVAAGFAEGFDDVTTLPGKGWAQINRSNPLGTTNWYQGVGTVFPAHTGVISTSYIAANYNNTAGVGTISNWLLTPEVELSNGAVFTFYTRVPSPVSYPDRLEVRLSTAGASTDVGSTETSVGDFTTLLLTVNPNLTTSGYPTTWTAYSVTLSGLTAPTTGRIGFRYYVTNGGPSGDNSSYIGIDTFSFEPAAGPCSNPADLPWINPSPTSGTINAGGSSTVDVQFDSTGLVAGVYTGQLCVASNDVANPLVAVPVTLTVQQPAASLTVNLVGDGTVDQDPLPPYFVGDVVTLTATPAAGWTFAGWSGDLTGTTNPITIGLTGNHIVTATFVLDCIPVAGVDFTYTPTAPRVGQVVTFNGTTLSGTLPITYTWDFGDGSSVGSGQSITHTFPLTSAVKTYNVVLTASNACSSNVQASKPVTVWPRMLYLPLIRRD